MTAVAGSSGLAAAEAADLLDSTSVALTPCSTYPDQCNIEAEEAERVSHKEKKEGVCSGCRQCAGEFSDVVQEVGRACTSYDYRAWLRRACTVDNLRAHFAISLWLPKYKLADFKGDLISGLTVALTVIPQALAYAKIAELPPQYGLYTSFMGCFMYLLLGTARDVNLGPTAVMSLLTAEFAHQIPTLAILMAFFSGIIQLIMAIFRIGFLVDYISHPVINSFTTAAAITIACSQIKKWWGLTGIPRNFVMQAYWTLRKIPQTNWYDFFLGLFCIVILYALKRVREVKWNKSKMTTCKRVCKHSLLLLCTARNAIVVVVTAGFAAVLLEVHNIDPFSLTRNITSGIPPFRFPDFVISMGHDNSTVSSTGKCFIDLTLDADNSTVMSTTMCFESLGIGLIIIPLVSVIEIIAVGKALGRKNGYSIDANQELLALGAANMMGSFVSAYPVTASFSRSAVASQSGARTTMGNLFTGSLVLLSLGLLTPLFYYIPDAALAAVIIMAVVDMIDFSMVKKLWRVNKLDLVPWFITFFVSLIVGFEYGILMGIAASLCLLLYPMARPKFQVKSLADEDKTTELLALETSVKGIIIIKIPFGLLFPAVECLQDRILDAAVKENSLRAVIIDFTHVFKVDYSSILGIKHLMDDLKKLNCNLIVVHAQPHVLKRFQQAKVSLLQASTVTDAVQLISASDPDIDTSMEAGNILVNFHKANGEVEVKLVSEKLNKSNSLP